jgi:prepilin-type N-terminal cleavage/methylation domain-containing protein/prepilin-type processing-associated H-X9-DG protein
MREGDTSLGLGELDLLAFLIGTAYAPICSKSMQMPEASSERRGFSLLELLCVIAVIAILAALLLPALTKARDRAKQTQCAAQLKDIAVAFHSFAHDHNNQFPMQVPIAAGGSLGVTPRGIGGRAAGDMALAYRHFQALASELRTPKMVICPADNRLPAVSFSVLSNQNLSYFASLNAELGNANSLLAGDRNLTNDWAPPTSVQQVGPNNLLRWSQELHRFRGNLLFSDGHVDQTTDKGLRALNKVGGGPSYALNLPVLAAKPVTVSPPASPPAIAPPAQVEKSSQQSSQPELGPLSASSGAQNTAPLVGTEKAKPPSNPSIPTTVVETKKEKAPVVLSSTNSVVAPRSEHPAPSEEGWFVGVLRFLKKFLWALYLGLLLLGLLLLYLRKRLAEQRTKAGTDTRTYLG